MKQTSFVTTMLSRLTLVNFNSYVSFAKTCAADKGWVVLPTKATKAGKGSGYSGELNQLMDG
jgi:hypothetical protein